MASTSSTTSSTTGSVVNSANSSRLTGLASGMDTESMVKSLMKIEQAKYDKLAQQKTLMEWKNDAYLEVNNLLKDFRDTYLSVLNSDTSLMSSSAVLAYKVTSDTTSAVTFSASSEAFAGSHVINSITSLATGANAASSAKISSSGLTATTALGSLSLTNALEFGSDGKLSFSINGKPFSFTSTDTLQDIFNQVNGDTTANATMSYSSLTGKISIKSKNLGSDSTLKIENTSGNAFADSNAAFGIAQGSFSNGTDAVLNIDGIDVTKDSNTFTIDGITYNLKNTTGTAVNYSVDQDVDGAVSRISKFIDAYNTLVEKLQNKLDETRDSNYQPLTDDQKSAMSETQITQWETKAKTGILQNDSYVSKLLSTLRGAFFDKVAGAGISASSIGLSTISYQTNGQIYLDQTKLKAALQTNPKQVADVLSKISYETDVSTKYQQSGLAARLYNTVNTYLNDTQGTRKKTYNTQLSQVTDSMTTMKTRMTAKENRYWTQFTAMEQAISRMNTQSQWLSAQFSSN